MSSVGIRELKTNASEIVRRVRERGEVFEITYYGEVVARLVPARAVSQEDDDLEAIWTEMDRLAQAVSASWTGTPSAVDAVREGRRD